MEQLLSSSPIPPRNLTQSDLFSTFENLPADNDPSPSKKINKGGGKDKDKACNDDELDDHMNTNKEVEDTDPNSDDEDNEDDFSPSSTDQQTRAERAANRAKEKEIVSARHASLVAEGNDGSCILSNSPRASISNRPALHSPWTRLSKISSDALQNSFRGQKLVEHLTWEWATCSGPSRLRNLRIVAYIAIAEHSAIALHRSKLLSDLSAGPTFLRTILERNTRDFRVTTSNNRLRQQTLNFAPISNNSTRPVRTDHDQIPISFSWPDQLITPKCSVDAFDLEAEMCNHNLSALRLRQQAEIQKAISYVESTHVSWQDTNAITARDKPAIDPVVHHALGVISNVSLPYPRLRPLFFST